MKFPMKRTQPPIGHKHESRQSPRPSKSQILEDIEFPCLECGDECGGTCNPVSEYDPKYDIRDEIWPITGVLK